MQNFRADERYVTETNGPIELIACCNGDCNQGRDCPARAHRSTRFLPGWWIFPGMLLCIPFWFAVFSWFFDLTVPPSTVDRDGADQVCQ